MSGEAPSMDYLHGYTQSEQKRLYQQARVLGSRTMKNVAFSPGARVLEIGCGVGAQSELLLEQFPSIHLVAVDLSEEQVARARRRFEGTPYASRVEFHVGDAENLPFADSLFDGAFICWVLEHLSSPLRVLGEVKRCLRPGASLHANEVFNLLHWLGPKSDSIRRYWDEYNSLQRELGGDPDVGVKMGYLLKRAGFSRVETEVNAEHWDLRDPRQRRWMCAYWKRLLLSASGELLQRQRVSEDLVRSFCDELDDAALSEDGILYFGWIKASARK